MSIIVSLLKTRVERDIILVLIKKHLMLSKSKSYTPYLSIIQLFNKYKLINIYNEK